MVPASFWNQFPLLRAVTKLHLFPYAHYLFGMVHIQRFFSFLIAATTCVSFSHAAGDKPNIVLVMADDQGWGDMAYNGDPVLKTPNFDEAAATGLRFDHFYAGAPVCSPTRASVMTGRTPNRMGVFKWGYPMRPQETTLAEALKTAGYATGHFGKWHLGSVRSQSPANPGKNGFDHWVSAPNFYDNDAVMSVNGKAVPMKGESSFIAVDAALDWMKEKVKEDAPIFAVVWFGSPHQPHLATEEYAALYKDEPKKGRQNFLGEISGMDAAYGKLRSALTDLGIRDNTILWYNSDNGGLKKIGNVGGLRGHKGMVYDGGLQVPAILEWPAKIKKHRIIDVRCVTSDIYPTLLEIVGVKVPNQTPLDGISLVPLIEGKAFQRSKPLGFWDTNEPGIGTPSAGWMAELLKAQQDGGDLPPHESSAAAATIPNPPYPTGKFPGHSAWIDGDWKLHRITPKKGYGPIKWELYNLAKDRAEEHDLIEKKPELAAKMKTALTAWLKSVAQSLNGEDY